jgi:hypothetical protein
LPSLAKPLRLVLVPHRTRQPPHCDGQVQGRPQGTRFYALTARRAPASGRQLRFPGPGALRLSVSFWTSVRRLPISVQVSTNTDTLTAPSRMASLATGYSPHTLAAPTYHAPDPPPSLPTL